MQCVKHETYKINQCAQQGRTNHAVGVLDAGLALLPQCCFGCSAVSGHSPLAALELAGSDVQGHVVGLVGEGRRHVDQALREGRGGLHRHAPPVHQREVVPAAARRARVAQVVDGHGSQAAVDERHAAVLRPERQVHRHVQLVPLHLIGCQVVRRNAAQVHKHCRAGLHSRPLDTAVVRAVAECERGDCAGGVVGDEVASQAAHGVVPPVVAQVTHPQGRALTSTSMRALAKFRLVDAA